MTNFIHTLRQYRIGEFAIFDIVTALLGVWLVAPLLSAGAKKLGVEAPRTNWLWLTLPIGLLVHLILGIKTPFTENILDPSGHYISKVVILLLILMGVRRIKLTKRSH